MNTTIYTYLGGKIDLLNIAEKDISIYDISTALSHACRFNGNCYRLYSVAEHSIKVLSNVSRKNPLHWDLQLAALMHDAHEAYIGDITRPVENGLDTILPGCSAALKELKRRVDIAICNYLELPIELLYNDIIIKADKEALGDEFRFWVCTDKEEACAYNSRYYTYNNNAQRLAFLQEFRLIQNARGVDYNKKEENNKLHPKLRAK